ncbi:MAG: phosphatase [Lewinellaceae bacterium]|nr:phosphatase [Lewinellaceae bacterium]
MKLAAIDIGSNAIRLQVIRIIKEGTRISFKNQEYIRFPLRLGHDVFSNGRISDETFVKFEKLMRTFKLLIELYEVDGYIARATSAMREARNGKDAVQRIATYFDLKIGIISGKEEAEYLSKAIVPYLEDKTYIHIDVGGGSTEINIYEGKEQISSKSFKVGSVRQLEGRSRKVVFKGISDWREKVAPSLKAPVIAVGTGGNINKLFNLSNQKYGRTISLAELQALRAYVSEFTYEQRMNILKMNPDRADVIIPASEIYTEVMRLFGADYVLVPGVGLKDGLLYALYEDVAQERIEDIQFLGQF